MSGTPKGAIAAGHRLTAEAGAQMLRGGGTAVDAGIAALAMACVCEPVLASLGGGGFAMLRDGATGRTTLLDFFPQTPLEKRGNSQAGFKSILADFGTATQEFHIGPATVSTPGIFAGIEALQDSGASMPLDRLFAPAVEAAEDGFEVTPYQHYLSTVVRPILTATPAAADVFAPDGDLPKAGSMVRNPGLAEAFRHLAQTPWTTSGIAEDLLKGQAERGHLEAADLAAYRVEERPPLVVKLNEARVFLNPLPAASGTLIRHALSHLEACEPLALARALEETDRARLSARGDLRMLLDRPLRQQGTTHISAIDRAGNACAITVSNGTGSGEMVGPYGFMLNNILGEDDVNPHGAADWPVNTRLASMMCPTLIETPDGRLVALGSGGSSRIRSAVFQAIARVVMKGADLGPCVAAPRLHVENGHLDVEALMGEADLQRLTAAFKDHRLWPERNMFFGGVHAVSRDGYGRFEGAGDGRREGVSCVVE